MAVGRPQWLNDLSRSFKRHRGGRTGWTVEVMRDRLRVVSSEFPPRSDEPVETVLKRRSVTLNTPLDLQHPLRPSRRPVAFLMQ
jgi:hypothetical protein